MKARTESGLARALGVAIFALCLLPRMASAEGSFLGARAASNANMLDAENVYSGITVVEVVENSPAAAAGIEPGDVLLAVNGVELSHPGELQDLLDSLPAGAPLELRIERNGELLLRSVNSVARIPPGPAPVGAGTEEAGAVLQIRVERRRLGFEFRTAEPERLAALGQSRRFGVRVDRIAERSPLRSAGIVPGDLLVEVDGRPIPSPDALLQYLDGLKTAESVDLTVWPSGGERRNVTVALYRPDRRLTQLRIPLFFSLSRSPEKSEYSALLGAFHLTRLANGSRLRLLWLFTIETGSVDELIDVGAPR